MPYLALIPGDEYGVEGYWSICAGHLGTGHRALIPQDAGRSSLTALVAGWLLSPWRTLRRD